MVLARPKRPHITTNQNEKRMINPLFFIDEAPCFFIPYYNSENDFPGITENLPQAPCNSYAIYSARLVAAVFPSFGALNLTFFKMTIPEKSMQVIVIKRFTDEHTTGHSCLNNIIISSDLLMVILFRVSVGTIQTVKLIFCIYETQLTWLRQPRAVDLSDLMSFRCRYWRNGASNSRECLNPEGEFHGCSEMSLERQKKGVRSERQLRQLPNIGL